MILDVDISSRDRILKDSFLDWIKRLQVTRTDVVDNRLIPVVCDNGALQD